MRAPAASLIATALVSVVVSLGAYVAWLNLDTEGHDREPCEHFVSHIHLPGGWILWS